MFQFLLKLQNRLQDKGSYPVATTHPLYNPLLYTLFPQIADLQHPILTTSKFTTTKIFKPFCTTPKFSIPFCTHPLVHLSHLQHSHVHTNHIFTTPKFTSLKYTTHCVQPLSLQLPKYTTPSVQPQSLQLPKYTTSLSHSTTSLDSGCSIPPGLG